MNNLTMLRQNAVSPLCLPTKNKGGFQLKISVLALLSFLTAVPFVTKAANSVAVPDQVTVPFEEDKVWIAVLKNDRDLSWPVKVSVTKQPAHGQTIVSKGNRIKYTPKKGFNGTDTLRYQVKDKKGFTSSALVTITVQDDPAGQSASTLLVAVPDQVTVPFEKEKVWIAVLDNDKNVKYPAKVTITSKPAHGQTKVTENNTINYTRKNGFVGIDAFMYQVVDKLGRKSLATVTVNSKSNGSTKPKAHKVTLSWEPVITEVEGYLVHSGKNSANITRQLSDLHIASGEIDEYHPSVRYKLDDLNVSRGETICFSVTAYNSIGESEISKPICKIVP